MKVAACRIRYMFGDGEEPWVERDDAIRLHPLDSIPPNRGDQTHRVGLDLTIATNERYEAGLGSY